MKDIKTLYVNCKVEKNVGKFEEIKTILDYGFKCKEGFKIGSFDDLEFLSECDGNEDLHKQPIRVENGMYRYFEGYDIDEFGIDIELVDCGFERIDNYAK